MKGALAILVLIGALLSPTPLQAEVWHCVQDNGTDLYTNRVQDGKNCEQYIPETEITLAPPVVNPPTAGEGRSSPTILMPYAHDGPTPPDYYNPYYPDYYSYPYDYYYPFYGGFFGFRHRPHIRPPFSTSHSRSSHFGTHGHSSHHR